MQSAEIFERAARGGTYVGARFSPETVVKLIALQNAHGVPNPLDATAFHTTIVYSKKYVPWEANRSLDETATATQWECFDTRDGQRCLVLLLDSPYLNQRWGAAMSAGALYDFPDYKPHITLSYNVPADFDPNSLPLPDFPIRISHEYVQPLRSDWSV